MRPLIESPAEARFYYEAGNAHIHLTKAASVPVKTDALSGRLYFSKSGWLLLSVPNALGQGAFDALDEAGVELPTSDTTGRYNAHITVMRPEEIAQIGGPEKITERGHSYRYSLGAVHEVEPKKWDGVSKVWYIEVDSQDLRELRRSYGLTPLPNENKHQFHITFGVRKTRVLQSNGVSKAASFAEKNEMARIEAQKSPMGHIRDGYIPCGGCGARYYVMPDDEECPACGGELKLRLRSVKRSEERGPAEEYCPHCDARLERDPYSGTCNSCGKAWPEKEAAMSPSPVKPKDKSRLTPWLTGGAGVAAGVLLSRLLLNSMGSSTPNAPAPPVLKLPSLPEMEVAAAAQSPLDILLAAKVESDRRNYTAKHALMRKLMGERPTEFSVETNDDNRGLLDVMHTPTGFRMHLPSGVPPAPDSMPIKAASVLLDLMKSAGPLSVVTKGVSGLAGPPKVMNPSVGQSLSKSLFNQGPATSFPGPSAPVPGPQFTSKGLTSNIGGQARQAFNAVKAAPGVAVNTAKAVGGWAGQAGRNLANDAMGGFGSVDTAARVARVNPATGGFLGRQFGAVQNAVTTPYLNPMNLPRGLGVGTERLMGALGRNVGGTTGALVGGAGKAVGGLGRLGSYGLNLATTGPTSLITGSSNAAQIARGVAGAATRVPVVGAGAYVADKKLRENTDIGLLGRRGREVARGAAGLPTTPVTLADVNMPGRNPASLVTKDTDTIGAPIDHELDKTMPTSVIGENKPDIADWLSSRMGGGLTL
jgi:hypothetical protein